MSSRILIADDDREIAEGLAAGLSVGDRHIILCHDAESAQVAVASLQPQTILCDLRLSTPYRLEGLDLIDEFVRAGRADIILITGSATDELVNEAMRRGARAVLHKPFELAELEALLPQPDPSSTDAGSVMRVPTVEEVLSRGILRTRFQPIVNLGASTIAGYEALTWLDSDSPMRSPEAFFEYAAKRKALVDVEIACIRSSVQNGAPLVRDGLLFLNVHPMVLAERERFTHAVLENVRTHGISPSAVVLELTEQHSIPTGPNVEAAIATLQSHGVRFAFDDVGMAHSHLPRIDEIRPAYLKVSQHFGTAFESDATRSKLVRHILALANDFAATLILEGIETQETATAARSLSIPLGQGYFFGRPAAPAHWLVAEKEQSP